MNGPISIIRSIYVIITGTVILEKSAFHSFAFSPNPSFRFPAHSIRLKTGYSHWNHRCYFPKKLHSQKCASKLNALTDRQIQFWEDCELGLNDVENVYASKGLTMDKIREFGKSARGEIEFPQPQAPFHEPSEENVANLTAKPFWNDIASDPELFPWAAKLEENYEIILEEFQSNMKQDSNMYSGDSAWQNQVMGEGWSAVRLQRLGVWNTENCKKFPKTYNLLKELDIPLAVRGVCFARQAPGSGVAPHSDGRNFILTSHLGLEIPSEAWIKVGDEKQFWEVGKLTTLDTSFQHSTGNPSENKDRYVLIIDFWHPELTEAERAGLEFVYDLRNKFESGQIPVRPPRGNILNSQNKDDDEEEEGQGIMGMFNSLFKGN